MVSSITFLFTSWARLNRFLDANIVDGAFDKGCEEIATGGGLLARVQTGRGQMYLRLLALAVVVLAGILIWSGRG
jgi:NADH-quinone oxidoreductase subunit L